MKQTPEQPTKINPNGSLESVMGQVTSDFFDRLARGEDPQIEEYAAKYPEVAHLIRDTFPALKMMGEAVGDGVGSSPQLAIGGIGGTKQLGDFRLLNQLGSGGMGVVYEAQQISMGRHVALKILPMAGALQQKQLLRFRNEVRAAAMLQHPNIVAVYSIGEDRGVHFYAMQLIRGQSLAEVIGDLQRVRAGEGPLSGPLTGASIHQVLSASENQRPRFKQTGKGSADQPTEDSARPLPADANGTVADGLSKPTADTHPEVKANLSTAPSSNRDQGFFRFAAKLGIQAAEALQHAHELGVLHRDIKPGNLMLDADAQLFVTDFGLARIEADAGVTMTGDILGTLRYMSPEQALAKRVVIDQRSDIYSLGVTLYELLTLQPAFSGNDRQSLLHQIAFEEPKLPTRINRAIPLELETIVMKAIAKNPRERYATAQELADDLGRYLDDMPIKAKPPTPITRLSKWSRRHVAVVWTLVVCGLFVTGTMAAWLGSRISLQLAVAAEVNQDMDRAVAALEADQTEVAKNALSGSRATLRQLGDGHEALRRQIDLLSDELKRHEKFVSLYKKARRRRDSSSPGLQPAYDAIALYHVTTNQDWQKEMLNTGVPEEFVKRVAEQVYEMLVLISHDNLLWMVPKEYSDAKKIQVIDEAHTLLKRASEIRTPTKGYYWVLAKCSQRMGDLTDGAVRAHHDAEALRLRALAEDADPQNAAELFYIARDRRWGCASEGAREPFNAPFKEGELLAAYREMLRVEPTYYNALFFTGEQLYEEGKYAEAVQAWNGCLIAFPGDAVAISNRAQNFAKLGLVDESLLDFNKAIEIKRSLLASAPESAVHKKSLQSVLRAFGDSLRIMGKPTEARTALEEALQLSNELVALDPKNPIYQGKVGAAKRALAKLDEASGEDTFD